MWRGAKTKVTATKIGVVNFEIARNRTSTIGGRFSSLMSTNVYYWKSDNRGHFRRINFTYCEWRLELALFESEQLQVNCFLNNSKHANEDNYKVISIGFLSTMIPSFQILNLCFLTRLIFDSRLSCMYFQSNSIPRAPTHSGKSLWHNQQQQITQYQF